MRSSDTELIVNACDAGREGELIFAYVYETASVRSPSGASGFVHDPGRDPPGLRAPASREEMESLEAAARSRSEADWVVGMNATRAASIRLRAAFDGAVSLGRVQTPTLALVARREEEIDAFRPEPYWPRGGVLRGLGGAALRRPLPRRQAHRRGRGGRGGRGVRAVTGRSPI